ncbi:cyclin-dependent kinase 2-interacting protein [Megachile rotundata]|uniref:cyclin-dependent kinase 2-interacting protein n=1 Tax=Megachile rotundata TaxID=143995 RepID=UPI003FCF5293
MSKEQFSPVQKILSPRSGQGKNLTGYVRHIRDLAADIHGNIQNWNALHLQGVTLLKTITQLKQDESYPQDLQELCDKLENICDALDDIVKSLGEIAHQIKITASLETRVEKLFITWPNVKFEQIAKLIYDAYSQETKIKRKILENVAHYYTESWKMLFLATWVHQPSIPENVTTALELLLIETGHR